MPALVSTLSHAIVIANVYKCGFIILTITKLSLVNVCGFTRVYKKLYRMKPHHIIIMSKLFSSLMVKITLALMLVNCHHCY